MLNFMQRVLANMAADRARRNAEQIEQAINATRSKSDRSGAGQG